MIQPQLNFDMTLKTLNLSFFWFFERFEFEPWFFFSCEGGLQVFRPIILLTFK